MVWRWKDRIYNCLLGKKAKRKEKKNITDGKSGNKI